MGILIAPIKTGSPLETPVDIEEFLSLKAGDVELFLADLSSVVRCDMRYGPIQLLHASLGDFLHDKKRSRQFYIHGSTQHKELALLCFKSRQNRNASSTILRYAYRSLVEHCSKAVMTTELEDLILEFPVISSCEGFIATCANQGFCAPFINTFEVYMFLTKFLTYLKSSPFQAAERLRGQHIKVLDYFFKAQLDKYYQHPQLTTYIAFLDSVEAWTIYMEFKGGERYPKYEGEFIHALAPLDTTLRRLDERGLCLHKVVDSHNFVFEKADDIRILDENTRICYDYRELLLEFLKNPARAGQHVLNGATFATAAFHCLQYVSETTKTTMFGPLATLQLALIYIRLLLPRSSKSEELINLAKNYTFRPVCTRKFAYDTRLAQEAIKTYLPEKTAS